MPPLLGVYVFTDRPPRIMPTGVIVFTAGHVATTANRRHHLQRKLSTFAADWFLHFHGCMILPVLIGLIVFTAGLSPSLPTGVLAYTVGWSHHRSWAFTSSPTGRLVRRRLVFSPTLLDGHTTVVGHPHFHRRLPLPPPTGISACTAGLLCRRCWVSTSSPPAAFAAADWYLRLHGCPIMPPLLGVYVFTAGCLRRCRLVSPPTRLAYYAAVDGRLRLLRRSWCLHFHGWLILPPFKDVFVFVIILLLPSPTDYVAADWCFYLHNYTSSLPVYFCWC
ncbi:HGWP repeat containing protein-like [Oryza sativa Japonica Group]|uniref:HGWP repeat containing protein-like n=1 Tax=Oryza sativa subsp. japonica TaxID=39947 RepID=Q5ZBF8_ORYSJ|nr:HGWP repeat containing protein-like [Oryza sativa Japonica Group]BAD61532.1 HGWP repeat containing protein-like [Oryza sativa Japonica Group]